MSDTAPRRGRHEVLHRLWRGYKATIVYGPTVHFYQEVFDDNYVYLELEQVAFEASYNRVMVPIPVHIWEVIRQHQVVDLSLATKTDEELYQDVVQAVDKRIAAYQSAPEGSIVRLFGVLTYGSADRPREEQIEAGLTYVRQRREHQRQIIAAVEALQATNRRAPARE